MNELDKRLYISRYDAWLSTHGDNPKSLGWSGGIEKQYIRFKAHSELPIKKEDSVLDIGCGFGDLYGFLRKKNHKGDYLGLDINPNLLAVAKSKHKNISIRKLDILEDKIDDTYDWVIASGIFNVRLKNEDNIEYITGMLEKMYSLCRKGISCDFMSSYVDFEHPNAFHLAPAIAIDIAKSITEAIVLKMDYLKYEYCMHMYRRQVCP